MATMQKNPVKANDSKVKANNVAEAIQKSETVKLPQISKKIRQKQEKIAAFNSETASNFERLQHTSNLVHVELMGMNKMIRVYLKKGKELTEKQRECLTFKNVVNYIENSKYADLKLFTVYQMQCVCSAVIKEHHKATKLAERAAKQGAIIGKKADALGK